MTKHGLYRRSDRTKLNLKNVEILTNFAELLT